MAVARWLIFYLRLNPESGSAIVGACHDFVTVGARNSPRRTLQQDMYFANSCAELCFSKRRLPESLIFRCSRPMFLRNHFKVDGMTHGAGLKIAGSHSSKQQSRIRRVLTKSVSA